MEPLKGAIANILIVVLSLGMVGAGMIKLMSVEAVVAIFDAWGFPAWSQYLIGAIEFLIGLAIFIPQLRKYALILLIIEMVGAFTVHMAFEEFWDTRGPILVMLASAALLYLKGDFPIGRQMSK